MKIQLRKQVDADLIKWQDGKFGTYTIAEYLGEDGVIELKAKLAGYKVERIDN